jgi:putative membrane protein
MKSSFVHAFWAAALLVGTASCSSKPDSVEQAQQTNAAKTGGSMADTTVTTSKGTANATSAAFDSEFMTKAASGGMLEVKLGQEVLRRATTPEAKQFAQQMVTDHTKGNAQLMAIASQKNITLPATMGSEQQKVYDEVTGEKGAALDQHYVKAMIADHQEDIKEYQEAVTKASDPQVKGFAIQTVPMLQMHLQMVQKIQPVVDAKK